MARDDEFEEMLEANKILSEELTRLLAELAEKDEVLRWYATSPAFNEANYIAITSNFKSNNRAREVLAKYKKEEE